ncbi:MAG: transporter [Alphaproteobacteria bacterium]|nr:transporter [Alphaproteobacteria bacterium]
MARLDTNTERLSGKAVLVYSSVGHLMFHFMGVFFFTIVLALQIAWEMPYHDAIKMWAPAAALTAAAALPAGWLGDRWSAPGIMVVFFIGMGLSSIAAGLTPERDIVWMTVALAGIGLFGSIYHPVGIPWVMRTADKQGESLGINGIFGSAGNAVAGLGVGGLIALYDWRAAFIVPGALSVLCGIAMLWHWKRGVVGDRPMPKSKEPPPSRGDMVKVFFILMVTMFMAGVIYQATQFALPKLFEVRLVGSIGTLQSFFDRVMASPGETLFWIGVAVSAVYTISGVMQYVAGRLADRMPLKLIYVGSFALQILAVAMIGLLWEVPVVLTAMIGAVLMVTALPAESMMIGRYTPSQHLGLAFGSKFVLSFAAGPVAIWLIAQVNEATGALAWVFYILALLAGVATIAALLLPGSVSSAQAPLKVPAEPAPTAAE